LLVNKSRPRFCLADMAYVNYNVPCWVALKRYEATRVALMAVTCAGMYDVDAYLLDCHAE
jgi:hypothetical protein